MVETVIFDQMSRHCDTELEDRKPIFLHIFAHDVASPYQVWLQKVQHQRIYHSDEHSLEFLTFSVTLTLTTTQQSFFSTRNHFMLVCHQTKFTCKRVSNSDKISKSHILIILFLTVSTRRWLMMLHHHTKFGNKMFCDSENIVRKNIY